jgi:hypothetical protein
VILPGWKLLKAMSDGVIFTQGQFSLFAHQSLTYAGKGNMDGAIFLGNANIFYLTFSKLAVAGLLFVSLCFRAVRLLHYGGVWHWVRTVWKEPGARKINSFESIWKWPAIYTWFLCWIWLECYGSLKTDISGLYQTNDLDIKVSDCKSRVPARFVREG